MTSNNGNSVCHPELVEGSLEMVEMLAPYKGRLFDPCCGSGPAVAGFVQSVRFVEAHAKGNGDGDPTSSRVAGLRRVNISIFGQGLIARRELGRAQHARRV